MNQAVLLVDLKIFQTIFHIDVKDITVENEQKDKTDYRVRNAAAALAIEHRQLLMEFCKNPEKSKALNELEEALSEVRNDS